MDTMSFDSFLDQAWADHGERPDEVARRLDQGYALIENASQLAPFARILAHVDGEHLARWDQGVARLERLRGHAQWRDDGDGALVVRRLIASLQLGAGQTVTGLAAADLAHAHAVTASALAAQNRLAAAIGHYRAARAAAASGLADGDPAIRALAVTSNNLAATLEEAGMRSARETDTMLDAAAAAREHWARAGGWLEVERADYMLAKCRLAAGDAALALRHALECLEICEHNGADAFERFFAHGVVAQAQRALGDVQGFAASRSSALAQYDTLPAEQRKWCEQLLGVLG